MYGRQNRKCQESRKEKTDPFHTIHKRNLYCGTCSKEQNDGRPKKKKEIVEQRRTRRKVRKNQIVYLQHRSSDSSNNNNNRILLLFIAIVTVQLN